MSEQEQRDPNGTTAPTTDATHCPNCGKRYTARSVNAADYRIDFTDQLGESHICARCWYGRDVEIPATRGPRRPDGQGTSQLYGTTDHQWACMAHGDHDMREDPQGVYCGACVRQDRDDEAALQLANAIAGAVYGPDPRD